MIKNVSFIAYLKFIFSGWLTQEINFGGDRIQFRQKYNSFIFNPKQHFVKLISSFLSLGSKIEPTNKNTFSRIFSSFCPYECLYKYELEGKFYYNEIPVTMRRYYYRDFRVMNSLIVYSFAELPLLIIDNKYDYGKIYKTVEGISGNNGCSELAYHCGNEVLICSLGQHTSFLYIPNTCLLDNLIILSNLKPIQAKNESK